jgi:NAD(P)H-flavin reductase
MPNPVKTKACVTEVAPYGAGVYSVKLRPLGLSPRAKPGQFLHLTVDEYDPAGGFWPESRVFSIASAPGASEIEIVYSVKGRYTRRMEESLAPGREVWLKLPYGEFIIDSAAGAGEDAVLVAGGTGVSPFLPYLEKILASGKRERTVRLYYGARENAMLLARGLLERCAAAGLVDVRVFIENEEPDGSAPTGTKAERGRLDIDRIRGECTGLSSPVYFLSGPPAMIKAFRERLGASGIEAGRIKIDEWE